MGLDNFWVDDSNEPGKVDGNYNICGGLCSGHGNNSFRGKVYNSIVEKVTGVSLYSDKINNDQVVTMDEKLRHVSHEVAQSFSNYEVSDKEWNDFQIMWHEHAKAGHHLVSWY